MRVDDLIDKIIANKDKWAYLALSRVEADMKTRVFNEGKDINEVGLGSIHQSTPNIEKTIVNKYLLRIWNLMVT